MVMFSNNTAVSKHDHSFFCHRRLTSETRGIWFGENPLNYAYPLTLFQIILVVMISRMLYYFLKPLGQTTFVCYLLVRFSS